MPQDYIPDSYQNRYSWLKNLHDSIDGQAPALGWDSGKTSLFKSFLAPMIAKYAEVIAKAQALDLATGAATDEFNDKLAELRRQLGELRKNAAFNPGMGAALGVVGTGNQPDPATIKPELKVKADMGHIRITGRKNYAQTVNIYTRLRPAAAWRLLEIGRAHV